VLFSLEIQSVSQINSNSEALKRKINIKSLYYYLRLIDTKIFIIDFERFSSSLDYHTKKNTISYFKKYISYFLTMLKTGFSNEQKVFLRTFI